MTGKATFGLLLFVLVGVLLAVLGSCAYFGGQGKPAPREVEPTPPGVSRPPPKPFRPLASRDIEGKPRRGTFGALEAEP